MATTSSKTSPPMMGGTKGPGKDVTTPNLEEKQSAPPGSSSAESLRMGPAFLFSSSVHLLGLLISFTH